MWYLQCQHAVFYWDSMKKKKNSIAQLNISPQVFTIQNNIIKHSNTLFIIESHVPWCFQISPIIIINNFSE